jgi:sodium-independent sulfate anion transporter 11
VVLLALSILTPFFQYIPRPTLAAVVIVAVLRTVNIRIIKKIWRVRKIDVVPLVVTFFACLYEIAVGIACGIAMALMILLYRHFLPRVDFQKGEMCYIKLDGGLSYMGVQYVITKVREVAILHVSKPETVIIDCTSMFECDFTVSQGFLQIVQDCEHGEINVILFNVRNNVKKMLINDGLSHELFRNDIDGEFSGLLTNDEERNGKTLPDKSDPSVNNVNS